MTSWLDNVEELVHSGRIKVPYQWWVGETGTHFFETLKEGKILGTFFPAADMVFMPPRKTCPRTFDTRLEWRELGSQGTLLTYTIPRYRSEAHPLERPFAYGIIKLDGADTGFVHLIAEYEEGLLKSGMRLEAVFREERQGGILDIKHFRPVK